MKFLYLLFYAWSFGCLWGRGDMAYLSLSLIILIYRATIRFVVIRWNHSPMIQGSSVGINSNTLNTYIELLPSLITYRLQATSNLTIISTLKLSSSPTLYIDSMHCWASKSIPLMVESSLDLGNPCQIMWSSESAAIFIQVPLYWVFWSNYPYQWLPLSRIQHNSSSLNYPVLGDCDKVGVEVRSVHSTSWRDLKKSLVWMFVCVGLCVVEQRSGCK